MNGKLVFRIMPYVTLVLVCACATPFDNLRNYKGQDAGHLVLSLGHVKNPALTPELTMRRLGTPDLVRISYAYQARRDAPPDFESPEGTGMVITKQLPPGEYEIYGFQLGIAGESVEVSGQFSIPVQVRIDSGEASYAGSYSIGLTIKPDATVKRDGQVVTVMSSGLALSLKTSDEKKRDMDIATRLHHELTSVPMKNYAPVRAP